MFGLLAAISTLFTLREAIKEKNEPVVPKGTRFDWNAYWKDVENGVSTMEQVKKRECGDYMTTKPPSSSIYNLPIDVVVDTKRYEHDKKTYNNTMVEIWRKNGHYRYKKKY